MTERRGPFVAFLAGLAVGAAARVTLDASGLTAALVGVVYGSYAWALWAYPIARRFHFRRLDGRDFWLGPVLLVVVAAVLAVPLALAVPLRQAGLLFVTLFGGLLAVGTLAGLLAHTEGLIDHDWR